MPPTIPIPPLTPHERIWLKYIYPRNLAGEIFSFKEVWSAIHKKLPETFRPAAMDQRVVSGDGTKIRLFGIIALEKGNSVLSQADKIVRRIRDRMLAEPKTEKFNVAAISADLRMDPQRVSLILYCIQEYGPFYRGTTSDSGSSAIKEFDVSGDDNIFYKYVHFPGMAALIHHQANEKYRQPVEPFSSKEMIFFDSRIDEILKLIKSMAEKQDESFSLLKNGHELIASDIEELKTLYFLGKKNWREVALGKFFEMTVGGMISETISKQLLELVKKLGDQLLLPGS